MCVEGGCALACGCREVVGEASGAELGVVFDTDAEQVGVYVPV